MKGLTRAMLVARTVRFLRPRQLLGRLALLRSQRSRPHPIAAAWDVGRARSVHEALNGLRPAASPAEVRQGVHAWRAGRLELIAQTVLSARTWREGGPSPLFAYHVHYHDILAEAAWVAAEDGDENLRRHVDASLSDWLSAQPNGGSPASDPYPTAVRTVNWTRPFGPEASRSGDTVRLHVSLATQIEMLAHSLEWHLDGNHLLRDAWALAIVPWCFEMPWGDAAGHGGSALYWRTLMEQVGADGVHEKRSPMYHAPALRDALEVVAVHDVLGLSVPPSARSRIAIVGDALRWMRHMDGRLRLINGSAGDHALDLDRLALSASMLVGSQTVPADGLWWARDAQFAALHDRRNGDEIFADLGAPAPRHQPGHSHAAALSFEWNLGAVPLIVDGGCSGYDADS